MIKIFIEAQKEKTSEYQFVDTLLSYEMGFDKSLYEIACVNGKDNLRNADNTFKRNTLEGGKNLIVFDADGSENGGGYENRRKELEETISEMGIETDLFLFPNNKDDGMFENLLLLIMLKDKYKTFFDCFNDYENCLGDDYIHPNLKGKVFTYISSMKNLTNRERRVLGNGYWKFDDPEYWNLKSPYLDPLKNKITEVFSK